MSDKKIRWGVISTANIGRWAVIPALHAAGNCELRAVASRDEKKASDFAAECGIPVAYGSYEALLGDDKIDAVYIPLPNSLHRKWVIAAANAGKHVLCEKPLALSEAECLDMAAVAERNGVRLMEAFMYRFHPRTERVLEMISSGVVGELKMIRSAFTFRLKNQDNIRLDPELGGGALMDVGCYCINISRMAAGAEPVEVQAMAEWSKSGVDEMMAGTLRFADGRLATFECGLNTKRREIYEIAGTEACLEVLDAFLPGDADVSIREFRDGQDAVEHTIGGVDEYRAMVEHFAECVIRNTEPRYSAMDASLNMRVIEALYRSVRNGGRTMPLDPQEKH